MKKAPKSSDALESSAKKRDASKSRPRTRQITVYDAVAGRVSTAGFISQPSLTTNNGIPTPFSSQPLTPEEVLYRRVRAPTRYMETDTYFANEALPADRPLPDSDLVKAIHAYSSDFYAHATPERGLGSWHSMDETALLAMGILLEEAAKESLGETGDMVFVEGEETSPVTERAGSRRSSVARSVGRRASTAVSGAFGLDEELVRYRSSSKRKRRRRIKESTGASDMDTG